MTVRNKVLWAGESPQPDVIEECSNRGLMLEHLDQADVGAPVLAQSRGIVYKFSPSTLTMTREFFMRTQVLATNHGLALYLIADNDAIQDHISSFVGNVKPTLRRRTVPVPAHEIAETMARYNPGPAHEEQVELQMEGELSPLKAEEEVLVKRAFNDCTHVSLRTLTGGLSARVFCAFATFKDSIVGPRPLPFFVKIDDRDKIDREKKNYELYASHFIPFNLRPNLDYRRCTMGSGLGILVGNFVDRSESLWDVARRGQAQAAIYSLFDDALQGWRLQAFCSPMGTIIEKPVADGLRKAFDYTKVQPSYVKFARERYGVTDTPIQLWEKLLGLRDQRYRVAPMHGDLHGNNVRVRGSDAILIDLASITNGPLVGDLAALETSLAFEVPPGNGNDDADRQWQVIVDKLYAPTEFSHVPLPQTEPIELAWLWNCVRQLRAMVGPIQVCGTEYQSAVAVYLLRRTMWEVETSRDAFRRGYAYVLAARLIGDLNQKV